MTSASVLLLLPCFQIDKRGTLCGAVSHVTGASLVLSGKFEYEVNSFVIIKYVICVCKYVLTSYSKSEPLPDKTKLPLKETVIVAISEPWVG